MDKLLRSFIKFHGYCIAVVSSTLTISLTSIFISQPNDSSSWEELYDVRYTKIPALVFGLAWMAANSLLIIGLIKEKKTFLYPFAVLFLLDMVLILIRDIYLVINSAWYRTAFFNFSLPIFMFIIPYVVLSMLAIMRLFDVDPISRADDSFVRFDRNSVDRDSIIC
ncbi:uncharacterized protein LOC129724940 [Wyeomyia smithii]|uniref:uncharacterized protein LOC129724940 n=1 Tax=Wyeomyia smithii TaxID=174621 RepID=UPI002467DD33|nr:uncharacterized protein LOC129724940 [Wyeomyia smithii]